MNLMNDWLSSKMDDLDTISKVMAAFFVKRRLYNNKKTKRDVDTIFAAQVHYMKG